MEASHNAGMESSGLLPRLERLPLRRSHERFDWSRLAEQSARMRGELFAVEVGVGAEIALSGLLGGRGVPDDLAEAYQKAFPSVAAEHSLHERYAEMVERGPQSVVGFVSNLKGKLAEIRMPGHLEQEFPGYSFRVAESQNQAGWDLIGVKRAVASSGGEADVLVQAKIGSAGYAGDVAGRMQQDEGVLFAVSSEIRNRIVRDYPHLESRFVGPDISSLEFTESVEEELGLLASSFGIDAPERMAELLPYVGEIVLGIRLLLDLIAVEKDFAGVEMSRRGRLHAMKALVLLQRFGVTSLCAFAGGVAGSALPVQGSIAGALGGAGLSVYLNRKLRPRAMDLAMWLAGVTPDDIFYLRNKTSIDQLGASLARTAASL